MNASVLTQSALIDRLSRLPKPVLWVIAARLKTLGLSLAPVGAGSWWAAQSGDWSVWIMLAAMGAAAAIQIGTNLWNDAADAASGVDGPDRLGPPRLTALGLLPAVQVRRAAAGAFAVAALLGLYLTAVGGWVIIAIGLVSLALGFFYSMGPRPLSGTPFGEALVVAFFGVVAVAGTVFLHGAALSQPVLMLGIVTGLPAAAVLLINNHRDRTSDALAGRRTLAILVGETMSRRLYTLLLGLSCLGAAQIPGLCSTGLAGLLPAVALAVGLTIAMAKMPVSAALNRLIPGTALFQMLLLLGIAGGSTFCS